MARRDKREAGKTFLENVLAKIPEDKRAGIREALLTDDIVEFAGENHLRHDEFSRMADDLRKQTDSITTYRGQLDKWKGDLTTWYTTKQKELETAMATRHDDDGVVSPAVDLSGYVKLEDHQNALAQTESQGLVLMSLIPTLAMKHYHEFKEVLDVNTVIEHAREKNLPLNLAYEDFVKPRVEERQKKQHDEALSRAREEGAIEERRRQQATPYPVSTTEPTTLDGLKPDFKKIDPVQAAIGDYYERQRSGAV